MPDRRAYNSPLRARQTEETRECILAALERRWTVFRHFESREALFDAFWPWFNTRLDLKLAPASSAELAHAPRAAFTRFDEVESVIRAALHSPSGWAMPARTTPTRREGFAHALAPALEGCSEAERRVTALAHLLYSAPACEVMKDFGRLTGPEAGEAASWALELILSAVSRDDTVADAFHSGDTS